LNTLSTTAMNAVDLRSRREHHRFMLWSWAILIVWQRLIMTQKDYDFAKFDIGFEVRKLLYSVCSKKRTQSDQLSFGNSSCTSWPGKLTRSVSLKHCQQPSLFC
jgi:hypothetical protein